MSTVCLAANTVGYPDGGGHRWVFLNWALGFRSLGWDVVWLEGVPDEMADAELAQLAAALRRDLDPHGLAESLMLFREPGNRPAAELPEGDLLLNMRYSLPDDLVERFPRSALIDIDPGLTQHWISSGNLPVAPHDVYFTIGETLAGSAVPDCGLSWQQTRPCVALDAWPARPAPTGDARFTTVSHWWGDEDWIELNGVWIENSKRMAFSDYLDLPKLTSAPLELALGFLDSDEVVRDLEARGWRVRDSQLVAATAADYQAYIEGSRGEFSCAKPATVASGVGWLSDRTLCYLATGRPAVVQWTGTGPAFGTGAGLLCFETPMQAAEALAEVERDYAAHAAAARALVEAHFDAASVVSRLLEQAFA